MKNFWIAKNGLGRIADTKNLLFFLFFMSEIKTIEVGGQHGNGKRGKDEGRSI